MELRLLITWVVSGGGAGVIGYWLMANIKWLANIPSAETKRYVSYAVVAVVAVVFYALGIGLAYTPVPVGWIGWVEQLVLIGTTAFGLSQLIHARIDLRGRDLAKAG